VGVGAAAAGAGAGAAGSGSGGPAGPGAGAAVIDPTAEDAYWREHYRSRPYVEKNADYESYRLAYRYGVEAHGKTEGRPFEEVESKLKRGWARARGESKLAWDKARDAVRDAYERTIQLHEEQLRARKEPVQTGEVQVRKEVQTRHETIDVPVEREEVVIDRRPASGRATDADFRTEEIRVPVTREEVHVEKTPVVKEEVTVGKRKVQDTKKVSGTGRKEELKVDQEGKAKVRRGTNKKTKE
jgi:uncharacterized protein (TIGR02271 family)